jgi:sugar phosphate isomerase/epimerase
MIGIVGHTGWIGSYIHRHYPQAVGFNTSNISSIAKKEFDLLFVCGVSAKKWIANKEPEQDLNNITSLVQALQTVVAKRCILISTIDIYSKTNVVQNELHIISEQKEAYGKNRYWFEQQISQLFTNTTIVRLPALFGFELKKNVIFDFLFRKTCTLHWDSSFQWYDMNWFLSDLEWVINNIKKGSINLFPEPLPNVELMKLLSPYKDRNVITVMDPKTYVVYNIQTIYGNPYWKSKQSTLSSLDRYIRTIIQNPIQVSNLAMHPLPNDLLMDFGVGQELVPYKTFGPDFISLPLDQFSSKCYSMQSLFYPHNWNLRDNYNEIVNYMKQLLHIANKVECHILVFGSPKLRSIGKERLADFLREINFFIIEQQYSMNICIEPNARYYGNEMLTTCKETDAFVDDLRCKHIGWMMDIGNMLLENENILECIQRYAPTIQHVHFSAKDLVTLTTSSISFPWLQYQFRKNGYKGKFTLEMVSVSYRELKESLYLVHQPMKLDVVGAGWYGCHMADYLIEKGYNVRLFEQKDDIFENVSSHNQNRLHEGYHYPRSFNTRQLCKRNYTRFLQEYGFCVSPLPNNLYFVANDSLLDVQTYKQIMQAENLTFKEVSNLYLYQTAPTCFLVQEGVIDFRAAKKYFKDRLKHVLFLHHKETNRRHDCDMVLDCTYNSFQCIPNSHFEPSVYWIYKSHKKDILSFTVMDGPFFSLYPYDIQEQLYTLTHVKWGRFAEDKRDVMEQEVVTYYPTFLDEFTFVESHQTQKHIMTSGCASRELQVYEKQQWISVACGKITGIFDWQDFVCL